MRLTKLDLLAFGHFRGLTLDFGAPGLHFVFGRNEAGKSTTLRAIAGLLYGIDRNTTDAHVHKMTDLRIGGSIEGASSSERLHVIRRKGNSNTLLDARSQQPIDEGVLKKLLGGVTLETFRSAYGLDHVTLGAGANALLEGKGDLGESLFDASVGGGGEVQRVLAELETEAGRIYKPRGSTLPLNEALRSFGDLQRTIREKQSLPEAFLQQERGLQEAIDDRAQRIEAKAQLVTRKARLERARRRVPLERRRERALEKKKELGAVFGQIERVEKLKGRVSTYERALEQSRAHAASADRLGERVAEAARRAGVDPSKDTEAFRLESRKEARLHTLLRERTMLTERIELTNVEMVRLERELERLVVLRPIIEPPKALPKKKKTKKKDNENEQLLFVEPDLDEPSELPPPKPTPDLGVALDRARALGDIESRLATENGRIERRLRDLHTRMAALGSFQGKLDDFVALRLPAVPAVERLEKQADDLDAKITRVEERLSDLEKEQSTIEKQLAANSGDFAPPDASALRASRATRDLTWKKLRAADIKARIPLETEIEGLLRDTDEIADRMIREADRVTTLARLRSEAETNARQKTKLEDDKAKLTHARKALDQDLATLFSSAKVPTKGFAEACSWLEGHAHIAEQYESIRETASTLLEEESKAARAKSELVLALGLEKSHEARLADLVVLAERRLEEIATKRRDAAEAASKMAEARTKLDEKVSVRTRDTASLAEVSAKLVELLGPLGIPLDASADEVNRSLEALRDLFTVVDERANEETRARVADADVRSYEADLSRAITELAPDLAQKELRDASPTFFARALSAREVAQELKTVQDQLDTEGEVPLDDEDRAVVADPDVSARVDQELAEQVDDLEIEITRLAERIGAIRKGFEEMRAESHAAQAAADAQEALARVRENVERWCRVRLASVLLSREIERYREANQAPLLASSSTLFSRLTLGAFQGVKAGFDEKDKPCLRCVRADAQSTEVDVTGLSVGTRDQLYLSLRLASLLRRVEVAESMPLVLDDVLVHFDDERATAALAVLAEVATKMQVLFFTHHARLVDLAQKALPADALVVHELESPPRSSSVSTSP